MVFAVIIIIIFICLKIYLKDKLKIVRDKEKEIDKLNDELKEKNKTLEEKEIDISRLKNDIEDKENDIFNKDKELDEKIDSLRDKEKEIGKLNDELKEKNKTLEEKEIDISKLKNDIKDKENDIFNKDKELDKKIDSLRDKEKEIDKLNNELNETKEKNKSDIKKLEIELKNKIKNIENLENLLKILNSEKSINKNIEDYKVILNKLYKKIKKNIIEKKYNFAFLTNIFLELKKIINEIENTAEDSFLYSKNIIAISGGCSAGKSSFINSLSVTDDGSLSRDIIPTTDIPSYVFNSEESKIECLTKDGRKVKIHNDIFEKISKKNNDSNFNAKNIVEHFYINKQLKYKNICFIDMPGYDSPGKDSEEDSRIAKEYINKAKVLMWLLSITAGTTMGADLSFLEDILKNDRDKIIYIVLTHADLKDDSSIKEICEEVKKTLEENGIKFEGISPYSKNFKSRNSEYAEKFKYGCSLEEFLDKYDKMDNITSYKKEELNNKIKKIFKDNIKLGNRDIKNINNNIEFLRKIKLEYISGMSSKNELIYRYRSLYKLEEDNKDNNKEALVEDNTEQIERNINNKVSDLKEYRRKYEEMLLYSNKIKNKILECVNNIFNGQ